MFETAKVGRQVSKAVFQSEVSTLRARLLEAQTALGEQHVPVIVLIAGMEGAGKGDVVNRLNRWLDTRGIRVHAFWDPSEEELERPRFWRFWRAMPARGGLAVLFGAWYQEPLEQRYFERIDDAGLEHELRRIREFERMLIEDGTLLVKFGYHFSEQAQRTRLKKLARDDHSRWKMLPPKRSDLAGHYRRFEHVAERILRHTDIGRAPWHIIEASDERYRDLVTGQTLLKAMENRLSEHPYEPHTDADSEPEPETDVVALPDDTQARITLLDTLDMTPALEKADYSQRLAALQQELGELAWLTYGRGRSVVVVFEGVDAAGKGGALRRVTDAIDARLFRSIATGAPSDEEKDHHYLWRFWRQIPRDGHIALFDRSWYGRVLVERVEQATPARRWRRAYMEINDFEMQLCAHGTILVKFWLHISPEEQIARFRDRERTAHKRYKITEDDWRNRGRCEAYRYAIDEMLDRTSTEDAPWTLIAGNDKRHARIHVLETLTERMRAALR